MILDSLAVYGWQGLILAVWVFLCVGSFLNVVIFRLPVMLEREWQQQAKEILHIESHEESHAAFNLSVPRSRCPACGHQIRFFENIPIISWLILRGQCSQCATKISWRYPAVELLTCLLSLAVLAQFGVSWFTLSALCATWLLIASTGIDFDTHLLPDQLTYPLLWLGLLTHSLFNTFLHPIDAIIGAVAGYLFLWLTFWAFKLLTGKEGMGYGDFKLFAALGAWLGWQALPGVLLIAAISGLIYALGRLLARLQERGDPIPFGPFLATAGWVTLLFRDNVLSLFQAA